MDLAGLGGLAGAAAVAVWRGVEKYNENRKQKDHGLQPNPERCAEERSARERLEAKVDALSLAQAKSDTRLDNLEKCADRIETEVRDIRDRVKI